MGIAYKLFALLSSVLIVTGACSSKSKSNKGDRNASQYNQNNTTVPPYSYQQTQQQQQIYSNQNNGLQSGGTSTYPGIFGGLNPSGGAFSLTSILGLLTQFLGLGNGSTGSPFSFLNQKISTSSTDVVQTGVAFYSDANCINGITTMPAGQAPAYYQQLCLAYQAKSVGAVALNGQCQSLGQSANFFEVCQVLAGAELAN